MYATFDCRMAKYCTGIGYILRLVVNEGIHAWDTIFRGYVIIDLRFCHFRGDYGNIRLQYYSIFSQQQ